MGERYETRILDLMLECATLEPDGAYTIEVNAAIQCVRQMLNEFEATIYQP